ncbi:hypothetical protein BDY19DRAFT_915025 [Irpex rosettiformis]|uniref:Uncharacterized protein n=1 Tax=Irpex rosettiformis TaxID=378272 RepID=A0ACB8UKY4_9APHY|nr:hypothetical protein BDY19DRAFT_915025 [Irpex rosettiformis]
MQAYHTQNYYAGHPQYPQRPPPGPQPGTYLTGFSATYPHFVQPPPPPGSQVPPPGYQPFPGAVYPPEQYDGYPVVPDRRRDRDRTRDWERERERGDKYGLSRSKTVATPNPNAVPLKSAMKRRHDRSASVSNAPPMQQPSMSRASSRAPSESRERTTSTGRRRADSLPPKYDYLFLTFPTSNEVKVENCDFHTVEELRQRILPSWPAGVGQEGMSRHEPIWTAQFNGTPWATSSTSPDSIIARRMICSIYAVLASQGYAYTATASTSNPPAKLIFARSAPEQVPYFFTISVSTSGSKLSILDAPPLVIDNLGRELNAYFQRLIEVNRTTADGETRIQIGRGNSSASDSDKLRFSTHVLSFLGSHGFKLDGSIPMGKAGPLGFGSRKELWIFRATHTKRPPSAGRNRTGSMNSQVRDGSAHGHNSMHDHDDQY